MGEKVRNPSFLRKFLEQKYFKIILRIRKQCVWTQITHHELMLSCFQGEIFSIFI